MQKTWYDVINKIYHWMNLRNVNFYAGVFMAESPSKVLAGESRLGVNGDGETNARPPKQIKRERYLDYDILVSLANLKNDSEQKWYERPGLTIDEILTASQPQPAEDKTEVDKPPVTNTNSNSNSAGSNPNSYLINIKNNFLIDPLAFEKLFNNSDIINLLAFNHPKFLSDISKQAASRWNDSSSTEKLPAIVKGNVDLHQKAGKISIGKRILMAVRDFFRGNFISINNTAAMRVEEIGTALENKQNNVYSKEELQAVLLNPELKKYLTSKQLDLATPESEQPPAVRSPVKNVAAPKPLPDAFDATAPATSINAPGSPSATGDVISSNLPSNEANKKDETSDELEKVDITKAQQVTYTRIGATKNPLAFLGRLVNRVFASKQKQLKIPSAITYDPTISLHDAFSAAQPSDLVVLPDERSRVAAFMKLCGKLWRERTRETSDKMVTSDQITVLNFSDSKELQLVVAPKETSHFKRPLTFKKWRGREFQKLRHKIVHEIPIATVENVKEFRDPESLTNTVLDNLINIQLGFQWMLQNNHSFKEVFNTVEKALLQLCDSFVCNPDDLEFSTNIEEVKKPILAEKIIEHIETLESAISSLFKEFMQRKDNIDHLKKYSKLGHDNLKSLLELLVLFDYGLNKEQGKYVKRLTESTQYRATNSDSSSEDDEVVVYTA